MEIVLGIILLAIGLAVFFIPTIIASSRGHKNTLAIFVLNLLLGWSGIIWVVALVWALMNDNN